MIRRLIVDPFDRFVDSLLLFMPNLLLAVVVLAAGLVISLIVRFVLHRLLAAMGLDRHAEKSGMLALLRKSGMKGELSRLSAGLVYWLLVIVSVIAALAALRLPQVDRLLSEFYLYLPNVFLAVIVAFIGYALSSFLAKAALVSAVNAGIRMAGLLSRAVRAVVLLLALTVALEQLGIGRGVIFMVFTILFAGLVLALSLAFGLGGKDIAKQYLEGRLKGGKEEKEERDEISHI